MARKIEEIPSVGIKLKQSSGQPLYVQLYNYFKEAILSKRLRSGQKLPGTRSLASELGVSRNTVYLAFEQLLIEGFIEGRIGSGSFVSGNIPDHRLPDQINIKSSRQIVHPAIKNEKLWGSFNISDRNFNRDELVPFQTGTPAIFDFPFDLWSKISASVLRNIKPADITYGDAAGYAVLRSVLAEYLRTYRAVKCEAEQIIIVNGSQQAFDLVCKVLLNKKSSVWVEDPGFLGTRGAITAIGAKIIPVPLDEDGLDIEYASKNLSKPDLIYTTPSHQFPLGYTMSISRRIKLLDWAKKNGVWILEDDYDSEYRYSGNPLPALQGLDAGGGVIYTGTLSKVLFPGLRLGYIVLPSSDVAGLFKAAKAITDRQSPIIDQIILTRFIEEDHFTKHIRKMRVLYKERQDILIDEIKVQLGNKVTVRKAEAGMHLIAWLPEKS